MMNDILQFIFYFIVIIVASCISTYVCYKFLQFAIKLERKFFK